MAELLLINPRKRRASKAKAKTRRVRRSNPIAKAAAPVRRRRNPIGLRRVKSVRRRRNPIGGGFNTSGIVGMLKTAAVGGAGSVGVNVAMGYILPYLPASFTADVSKPGLYDALKVGITIALGEVLNKPTKGLSRKMAAGALTVQASEIIGKVLPASMVLGGTGYSSPARIMQGTQRIGPNMQRVGAYSQGATPLLSAYQRPGGATALLSGGRQRQSAREREGWIR